MTCPTWRACLLGAVGIIGLVSLCFLHQTDSLSRIMTIQFGESVEGTRELEPSAGRRSASRVRCDMATRLDALRSACANGVGGDIEKAPYIRVIVDNNRKLTYTTIAKAGSKSWTTFLQRINDVPEEQVTYRERHFKFPNCRNGLCSQYLNETQLNTTYKDYMKIASVRHPLQRLVSAYFDFVVEGQWHHDGWPAIQKALWGESFDNKNLSFIEFAWHLTHNTKNQHWRNYLFDLQPCTVKYDYIFKIETLPDDIKFLANELNEPSLEIRHQHNNAFFSSGSPDADSETEVDQLTRYDNFLRELRDNLPDVLDFWLEYFRSAMDMFGYVWDGQRATSRCYYGNDTTSCC